MYSFAQRKDTTVVDEPIYAHYLHTTNADTYHPGAAETLQTQDTNWRNVMRDVIFAEYDTPIVFFKQMTHHMVNIEWDWLRECTNVLLTRDPVDMLPSYAKNIELPPLHDTGYAIHLEMLDYLKSIGQTPPVLESKQVLLNPESVLRQLCNAIDIPFDPAMLTWDAGARPEDGSWAKYWYHRVHASTGFAPYVAKNTPFPEKLKPLLAQCVPLYEELAQHAIQAN